MRYFAREFDRALTTVKYWLENGERLVSSLQQEKRGFDFGALVLRHRCHAREIWPPLRRRNIVAMSSKRKSLTCVNLLFDQKF